MVRKSVEGGTVHLRIMPFSALKFADSLALAQLAVLLSVCTGCISSHSDHLAEKLGRRTGRVCVIPFDLGYRHS